MSEKNTIYIIPIEPIDQRYTKQWYDNIPVLLDNRGFNVVTIDGSQPSTGTTAGAFLDFGVTNIYKSSQITAISKLFSNNKIVAGDKFLVTDAWNYAIIAIKYMSDLLDIPVEIHSIWHAGSYDPTDILGMKMQQPWAHQFERSVFYASDYNYYASYFHKDMFLNNLRITDNYQNKTIRSGQPHDLIIGGLLARSNNKKKNVVMWPHRYNDDKQPEIIQDMISDIRGEVVITQKMNLSKEEYYDVLGTSKVLFSCSLHENLGISMMEGCIAGAIPVVPDRASYKEMYLDCFKYPSEWTSSYSNYQTHKQELINFINDKIDNYEQYSDNMLKQKQILIDNYLKATIMVDNILSAREV